MKKLFALLILALSAQAAVINGDFENGNANWTEQSVLAPGGQLICTVGICGDANGLAGPYGGDYWTLFGAVESFQNSQNPVPEDASITQSVTFPGSISYVTFFLWIGNRVGTESDYLRLYIDGNPLFEATAVTPGYDQYEKVEVPVPSQYWGGTYDLVFAYHAGVGSEAQVMSIDNVSTTPEPSTWMMAGLGLLVYARKVRRRI
jgi:hypothetical protein